MDIMSQFELKCRRSPRRIVLPESEDPRIIKAASIVSERSLAFPILVGEEMDIRARAREASVDLSNAEIVSPGNKDTMESFVEEYLAMRGRKSISRRIAKRLLSKNLLFAAMMARMGQADGVVAGAANLTASVIKAGKLLIGLREGITEASSFFVMVVPGLDPLIFADCAVNPNPEPELLAQIAVSSAASARSLLSVEPRVAMLSFSTKGSADHPDVRKVARATEMVRKLDPGLCVDGEMQADAAIVPEIALRKKAEAILGGRANVLIFPDLDAGNIAYKLVQHLARAKAYGPFLQGFRKPINDLSRGCTAEEIAGSILVTSIQAGESR